MGDALLRVATGVSPVADADRSPEPHAPYTSPTTEYTPPTSPQPQMPQLELQMDTADAPPYEHPVYSPSPADSPSLPLAALPSPNSPNASELLPSSAMLPYPPLLMTSKLEWDKAQCPQ
ncbi:unnamed protein product [Alternaria alternata]